MAYERLTRSWSCGAELKNKKDSKAKVINWLSKYEDIGTPEELEKYKEFNGCGCVLCLLHNNWICPKMPKNK